MSNINNGMKYREFGACQNMLILLRYSAIIRLPNVGLWVFIVTLHLHLQSNFVTHFLSLSCPLSRQPKIKFQMSDVAPW